MSGKQQKTDNSQFLKIAGNFRKYSDLTQDGKNIVQEVISKCACAKKYPAKKVYYVLYNCTEISRDRIMFWLQRYYAEHKDEALPNDNTARKFLTMAKQLSKELVDAHNKGVKIYKAAQDGMYYLTPVQKYEIDKMYNNGLSAQEIIIALQKIIDDSAN
ncbi:TPA: hypothetical protein R4S80_000308 [Klebsiella michiganensis]|nr:hypothetical protein [Klebsiella michiganensis]